MEQVIGLRVKIDKMSISGGLLKTYKGGGSISSFQGHGAHSTLTQPWYQVLIAVESSVGGSSRWIIATTSPSSSPLAVSFSWLR